MNPQEKRDIVEGLELLKDESRTDIKKLRIDLLIEKVREMDTTYYLNSNKANKEFLERQIKSEANIEVKLCIYCNDSKVIDDMPCIHCHTEEMI